MISLCHLLIYKQIFGSLDASQVAVSAGAACLAAVFPIIPTTKNKLIAAVLVGLGDGAYAMADDIYNQYDEIGKKEPEASIETILKKINWQSALVTGGANFLITSISTGVTLYAKGNPRFIGFAKKLEEKIQKQGTQFLEKAGLNKESIDALLKKLKIKVGNVAIRFDDVYNAQKTIINQWRINIATASSMRKGNFGEIASDAFLAEKNFEPLHTRLQNIDAPTRQGIDGVFRKGDEYFIVEAKYSGTATLSTLADGTKQMSDAWIGPRLLDAVNGNSSLRNQIANRYRRLLAEIAPDGTVVYKELDANTSVIGIHTMRDKLKDKAYFSKQVIVFIDSVQEIGEMIRKGKTAPDRINFMKRIAIGDTFNIINSLYSGGNSIAEIKPYILNGIKFIHESWDGFWNVEFNYNKLNQYGLGAYDEMLWMLALGYLLNIGETDFKKLVEVIDQDGVKDYLFEFIIRAKLKNRQPIKEESYQEFFGVPQTFEKLRQAITETDKTKAEKLVKEFITKDWYKNHKDAGWYDSHKSKHDTYFGYWSFETVAVVKIMGLDDSSFRDCQYYPKDLVHEAI